MSEVILAATRCRTVITEIFTSANALPGAGNWNCEATAPSTYVASIGTEVNGKKVTLIPLKSDGSVPIVGDRIAQWVCGGTGTDVDKKYLPGSCRG